MMDSTQTEVPHASDYRERFGLAFVLGLGSLFLFTAAQVLAFNESAWFGLDPRNAAHNFYFNFAYFFPAIFLSSLLALGSLVLYFKSLIAVNRGSRELTVRNAVAILPSLAVVQDMLIVTKIIAAMVLSP
jgi:hypothetical protein